MNIEKAIEHGLFASRWLMAPFYIGLVGSLMILLYAFLAELAHLAMNVTSMTQSDAVLGALSLIDLSLAGNLVIIVIFLGYENFVSKIDVGHEDDQPEWRGNVDFASLKLKLVASIVAISGIHLLKVFMNVKQVPPEEIKWMIIIHVVFVFSGVMLAAMDAIAVRAKAGKKKVS